MFKPNLEIEAKIIKIVFGCDLGMNISEIASEANVLRMAAKKHLERLENVGVRVNRSRYIGDLFKDAIELMGVYIR